MKNAVGNLLYFQRLFVAEQPLKVGDLLVQFFRRDSWITVSLKLWAIVGAWQARFNLPDQLQPFCYQPSFEAAAGQWFGLGVLAPRHRNMEAYAKGALTFAIQSRSPGHIKVGIKSSQGEAWMPLGDEKDEFGFARDGNWHQIRIPLSRLKTDLRTVHQLFMLAGDAPAADVRLSIDDVRWESTMSEE